MSEPTLSEGNGTPSRRLSKPAMGLVAGLLAGTLYGVSTQWALVTISAAALGGAALGTLLGVLTEAWARHAAGEGRFTGLVIFLVELAGLGLVSGSRLEKHSADNHFVYLADSLNHGTLAMRKRPPHGNDWAKVTTLTLKDGRTVRGRWWHAAGKRAFRTTSGRILQVPPGSLKHRKVTWYVSFPPLPGILMMPGVAIWGYHFNDVWFTILFAALNPLLAFFLLAELKRLGHTNLSRTNRLWLTFFLTFGTVHFYSAVMGEVWYTAHIVGISFMLAFLYAALRAAYPLAAGMLLVSGFITRTPMLFAFPFFLFQLIDPSASSENLRDYLSRIDVRRIWKKGMAFALPVLIVGLWMAAINQARFGSWSEFGHRYLQIRWAGRIERWGLFSIYYIPRNLSVAFTLLPYVRLKAPYITISRHGISLLATTPLLFYVLWPKQRGPLHLPSWLSIAPMALAHFMYQNSGYVQFSYRFSLDYTPLLLVLLTMTGRPLGKWAKFLILWGLAWQTFGALSFGRWPQFYAHGDWLFVVT